MTGINLPENIGYFGSICSYMLCPYKFNNATTPVNILIFCFMKHIPKICATGWKSRVRVQAVTQFSFRHHSKTFLRSRSVFHGFVCLHTQITVAMSCCGYMFASAPSPPKKTASSFDIWFRNRRSQRQHIALSSDTRNYTPCPESASEL
jgi:hypothetical protein